MQEVNQLIEQKRFDEALKFGTTESADAKTLARLVTLCRTENRFAQGWELGYRVLSLLEAEQSEDSVALLHQCLFDMSILAFYVDKKDVGLALSSVLMLTPHCRCQGTVRENLCFYTMPLKEALSIELRPPTPMNMRWNRLNPGLVLLDNGMLTLNVRTVNSGGFWYTLNDNTPVSKEHPIVTKNFRATVHVSDLDILSKQETWAPFECDHKVPARQDCMVLGLEDTRLFSYRAAVWFMATTFEFSPDSSPCMFLGNDVTGCIVQKPVPLRCEKNWLPFEHDGKLLAIYCYNPRFTIFELDPASGCIVTQRSSEVELDLSSFRGSAPPVSLGGELGYIFAIHEVIGHPDRRYTHRFVRMSASLELTHLSHPFVMLGKNKVEYISGLAVDHHSGFAYISWGDKDERAVLSRVPLKTILDACLPLSVLADPLFPFAK